MNDGSTQEAGWERYLNQIEQRFDRLERKLEDMDTRREEARVQFAADIGGLKGQARANGGLVGGAVTVVINVLLHVAKSVLAKT